VLILSEQKSTMMKAAVIYQKGALPKYTDFPEPRVKGDDELLVSVKAVSIKHLDKGRASGAHYSSEGPDSGGHVPGSDGVCILEDGTRVYGMGTGGMLAEKALIHKDRTVPLPAGLDDATAAALPNAVAGAAMGLRFKAEIQPGNVVLINGATGFTGRVAVQIAKHYGAKKVIATGRNQQSLQELLTLGADEVISVLQVDDAFKAQIKAIHAQTPVDIVIDYLWGHSAELIFSALKGDGGFGNRIRYVSVGTMGGDAIQLSAAILRSVDLQLSGSGMGSWTKQQVSRFFSEIMPEMFQLAAEGRLRIETIPLKLADIEKIWQLELNGGQRPVVMI
jgi:NADPH:quinone reductase-like Zn-dependent oxidoreductase